MKPNRTELVIEVPVEYLKTWYAKGNEQSLRPPGYYFWDKEGDMCFGPFKTYEQCETGKAACDCGKF